jgi:phosphohistidine phosphatase
MDIYIIRHGPAGDPDPDRWPDDGRRPLTKRGMRKVRDYAAGLRRLGVRLDWMFTSPLLRAVQTAALSAPKLRVRPERLKRTALLLPTAKPDDLLRMLRGVADADGRGDSVRIAVVGHQPHLGELLARLIGGPPDGAAYDLRKGSATFVRLPAPSPSAPPATATDSADPADSPRGELVWSLSPRVLRRL